MDELRNEEKIEKIGEKNDKGRKGIEIGSGEKRKNKSEEMYKEIESDG